MFKLLTHTLTIRNIDKSIKHKCITKLDEWDSTDEKGLYLETLNVIFDNELKQLNKIIGKHNNRKYRVLCYLGKEHLFEVQNELNTIRKRTLNNNFEGIRPYFVELYN